MHRARSNSTSAMSHSGRIQLVQHEGIVRHYYNDAAQNCTYGIGTLVHTGACTAEELRTRISDRQIAETLQQGIHAAENAVRRNVTHQQLTQAQFDALVSFTYNVGASGARNVLRQVDRGHFPAAANMMQQYVHATVHQPDGRPMRRNGHIVTQTLPGLVTRRMDESEPFRRPRRHR